MIFVDQKLRIFPIDEALEQAPASKESENERESLTKRLMSEAD